jgi:NTP pyrophosphatase (non-canonical NTP hydrolase)
MFGGNHMNINEYQNLAMRTSNAALSPDYRLLNGVLGLVGESGEIADLVKKHLMQGHDLDLEHIAKELGDVCWYIAETATAIGYDMETIMQMNIDKLRARYPNGFDTKRSNERAEGDV